jgi:hypothetical protein
VLAARADPRVQTYGYRLVREWVDDGAEDGRGPRCRRGHELPPVRYGVEDCCCADGGHFRTACTCGDVRYVPQRGPACGPVPHDPQVGTYQW